MRRPVASIGRVVAASGAFAAASAARTDRSSFTILSASRCIASGVASDRIARAWPARQHARGDALLHRQRELEQPDRVADLRPRPADPDRRAPPA